MNILPKSKQIEIVAALTEGMGTLALMDGAGLRHAVARFGSENKYMRGGLPVRK